MVVRRRLELLADQQVIASIQCFRDLTCDIWIHQVCTGDSRSEIVRERNGILAKSAAALVTAALQLLYCVPMLQRFRASKLHR